MCYNNAYRMPPQHFLQLHDLLVSNYGLTSSSKSTSIEAVGMFLWILGQPESFRAAEDRFERSLGTVSRLFDKVLNAVMKLAADIIKLKPSDPEYRDLHPRLRNARFHVVSSSLQWLHRCNGWHPYRVCSARSDQSALLVPQGNHYTKCVVHL
jgi:hypothetical protein